jgi:16S rRNA (guanine1516-N2)-methyltransferase
MNELIKIKMSDHEIDSWPEFLQRAVNDKTRFCLTLESERKLCDLCDYLYFDRNQLFYHSVELGLMTFDFLETYSYHQRQQYAITKEPLARALGIKGNVKPIIWDTTCGTGKDSLLIHYFGGNLKSFERHPAVYLLLEDAKRRYPLNFEIEFADPLRLYKNVPESDRPDVIYYDPMFPEKIGSKKSALPRKEMRIFKEIVGEDLDSREFLEWALSVAKERVVVKRSLAAVPIKENPTASYSGKSTRYDMYKIF